MLVPFYRSLLLFSILLLLPIKQIAAAVPSECQEIWQVNLHSVARKADNEQNFSRLKYYHCQENCWHISDAETFYQTLHPEIPLIIFVPGYNSSTSQIAQLGFDILRNFDSDKPCRILLWDWYSEKEVCRIRKDIRGKIPMVDNAGDYLALLLEGLAPQSKVCLFGFSFGSRIICQAIDTLQEKETQPEGLRLHLVLSGAALDQHWFAKGQRYGQVPGFVEKILVTYNPEDWALRFYPFMYNCKNRTEALGYKGLPMRNIAPEYRNRFENLNVNRFIGSEHLTLPHVQSPGFQRRIGTYFFFE